MDAPILHLSIPVDDLAEARRFYVSGLDCRVGRVRDDWLDVWFFGLQLTLQHRPDEVRPPVEQGVRHFGVALTDADELTTVVERLDRFLADDGDRNADETVTGRAHWISRPAIHGGGELSGKVGGKVSDPSGNVIEIKLYPDPSALRSD